MYDLPYHDVKNSKITIMNRRRESWRCPYPRALCSGVRLEYAEHVSGHPRKESWIGSLLDSGNLTSPERSYIE